MARFNKHSGQETNVNPLDVNVILVKSRDERVSEVFHTVELLMATVLLSKRLKTS